MDVGPWDSEAASEPHETHGTACYSNISNMKLGVCTLWRYHLFTPCSPSFLPFSSLQLRRETLTVVLLTELAAAAVAAAAGPEVELEGMPEEG